MDQHSAFPQIAGHSKASDSTDTGLLDKNGGMCSRQGVPYLETLFLSHSAVSNSSHLYLMSTSACLLTLVRETLKKLFIYLDGPMIVTELRTSMF